MLGSEGGAVRIELVELICGEWIWRLYYKCNRLACFSQQRYSSKRSAFRGAARFVDRFKDSTITIDGEKWI